MAGLLPPVIAVLTANVTGFKAGMAEAKGSMASMQEGGMLGPVSNSMMLAAGAAVALGGITVKMAADFQQATNRLATSAGETRGNLDMVSKGILDMAGQVGFTAQDLAKAMYTVDSAGFHAADSLTILKASAQGAKIEQADLGTTVDAVTTSLVDYHLGADQAANVMSKLVTAVGEGKTTLQELAGSLHSVTPLASNLHISLDEVTAAVATMTVHGMSADQATQNLADTIRHLASPTQTMTAEMGQLGINSQKLAASLQDPNIGLHGVLEQIYSTIMQHMGPAGDVLLGTFKNSAAASDDLNRMLSAMPPQLKTLAQGLENGSVTLEDWRKGIKGLPADMDGLATQFFSLYNRANGFSDALKSGSPAAQTFEAALAKMMGDSTGLNTALMLGGENMDRFNNNIKAVAGSTADASGDVKNWSDVQDTLNQQIAEFEGSASSLAVKIGKDLLPVVTGFFKDMNDSAKTSKDSGIDLGTAFKDADGLFRDLTNDINNMPAPKGGLFGALFNSSDSGFNKFADDMAKGFNDIFGIKNLPSGPEQIAAAQQEQDQAYKQGVAVGSRLADGVNSTLPQVTDAKGKLVNALYGPAGFLTGTMYDVGVQAGSTFANGVTSTLPQVQQAANGLVSSISGPAGILTGTTGIEGMNAGNSFANGVASTVPLAGSSGNRLSGAVSGAVSNLPSSMFTTGVNTTNSFANGVVNPLPQAGAAATSVAGRVSGPLSALGPAATSWGNTIGANLAGALWGQANVVGGAAAGIAASIRARFPSSPAKEGPLSGSGSPDILGRNIGRMVSEGITSTNGMVSGSVNSLVNFGRGSYSMPGIGPGSGGLGGSGNVTVAIYLDGKLLKNAIQKATLRDERVNVSNGQSIRGGR